MAEHKVRFQVPWRDVGNTDVVFKVWQDEELFGTLKISRGAVVWSPANAKRSFLMEWDRFDKSMRAGRKGTF